MVKMPKVEVNTDISEGLCFGCGPNNPIGLKLHFAWDGQKATAQFTPAAHHEGWRGVVHAGVIATMVDEAMTWAVYHDGHSCLTVRLNVTLKHPAKAGEPLTIVGSIAHRTRKLIDTAATITGPGGLIIAEATATQFVLGKAAERPPY